MSGVYHIGSVTLSLRGFPWWTEQVTKQTCFFGPGPDDNCGFLNYGQALAISLSVSFFALLAWLYLHEASASKERRLLRAAGLSLLSFGLLIATVVFAEVQVMNSIYRVGALTLRFEGFPFGGQEVLGSGCILGSDPLNCYFFNYDQLLLLAAVGTFVGLFLWLYSRDEGSSHSPPAPRKDESHRGPAAEWTADTDSNSTRSIFETGRNSCVSWNRRVAALLPVLSVILALRDSVVVRSSVITLTAVWWVIPLSACLASVVALAASAMLRNHARGRVPSSFSTFSYLITCPSLLAINVLPAIPLGATPPGWVGNTMLALLLCSAWLYYKAGEGAEEPSSQDGRRDDASLARTPFHFSYEPISWQD